MPNMILHKNDETVKTFSCTIKEFMELKDSLKNNGWKVENFSSVSPALSFQASNGKDQIYFQLVPCFEFEQIIHFL